MKKILTFLVLIIFALSLVACGKTPTGGGDSSPSSPITSSTEQYTVTFIQEGYAKTEFKVEKGGAITQLPLLVAQVGYNLSWDKTLEELANVNGNMVVTAIKTAKEYKIVYDEFASEQSTTVCFGKPYELFVPQSSAERKFVCWNYLDQAVASFGEKWNIDGESTITLSPLFADRPSITFVQDGYPTKTFYVDTGEDFTDIPNVVDVIGYDVAWDKTASELTNITEPIVVTAIFTPKEYFVSFDLKEGEAHAGDIVLDDLKRVKVVFGQEYFLGEATKKGYDFIGWKDENENIISKNGDRWAVVNNVVLTACFQPKTYTVTLDIDGGNYSGETSFKVTFGENYNLGKPTRADYKFIGWFIGDDKIEASGTWRFDSEQFNITIRAKWQQEEIWTSLF